MKNDSIKEKVLHGIHVAHSTEVGKKAMHTVTTGAIAVGTAALTPVVGATLAPVVAIGAIGYGLWRLLNKD